MGDLGGEWGQQPGPAPRSPAWCQGPGAAGLQQAGVSDRSRSLSPHPFSPPIPLQRKVSRPHILFQGWMSYPLCLGGVPLPETPLPLMSENGGVSPLLDSSHLCPSSPPTHPPPLYKGGSQQQEGACGERTVSPLSKTLSLINECIRRRDGGGQLGIRGGRSRIKIGGRGVEKEGTGLAERNVPCFR